jgi:hypothetical protein
MSEWVAAWETHFNLGAGEIACNRNRHEVVSYWGNRFSVELCFGWRGREDELDRGLIAMIPEIRRKYYLNKTPRLTDDVTVAIHVRRGDVSASHHLFTSTEAVLQTATLVKSILDSNSASYRISVYSQGDHHDFEKFSLQLGAELFLDADAIWTMRELIEADILIMAKGCFSTYAALISDGIRIVDVVAFAGDRGFKKLLEIEDLILREPDGSFDVAKFERQLRQLLEAKNSGSLVTY